MAEPKQVSHTMPISLLLQTWNSLRNEIMDITSRPHARKTILIIGCLVGTMWMCYPSIEKNSMEGSMPPLPREIITTQAGSWRSATVFTHVIWRDLLFYGGGSGTGGGDPRHEMEIGVFHLITPDSGYHHPANPVVSRAQFGLDEPGKGITPLFIFERGDSLFMYCTSRPDDDLEPHIVQISASIQDPFTWGNYRTIVDESFSGKKNNHGATAIYDPADSTQLLLYFAARTAPDNYRILLARAPVQQISDPTAYQLIHDYERAVLSRDNAKVNYPSISYNKSSQLFELWYSGETSFDPSTRSCYRAFSEVRDSFEPSPEPILNPSLDTTRNDNVYATGPKVHGNYLYYSGRNERRGNYLSIFCQRLEYLR